MLIESFKKIILCKNYLLLTKIISKKNKTSKSSCYIKNNLSRIIQAISIFIFLIIPISCANLQANYKQNYISQDIIDLEKKPEIINLISQVNSQNRLNSISNLASSARSFSISASELSEAKVLLGCENNFLNFSLRGRYQDFVIFNKSRPVLITSAKNDMMIFSNYLRPKQGIDFTGTFKVKSVPQWRLVYEEDFSKEPIGWSKNVLSECGGIKMLGGYCEFGAGEVVKTFDNLPFHSQIRIESTFHFIDAWHGEAGFLRVNNGKDGEMQYAWIENYSAFEGDHGINVCGGKWPEGKFSVPINFSIPHKADKIKIGFGSTTEQDPCDQSFGVSGIRIYIR